MANVSIEFRRFSINNIEIPKEFEVVEWKSLNFLRNFNVFDKKVKETIEKTDKTYQNW